MIIKKYTGKTEAEATEAAKKELGSGLVIMNVREVKNVIEGAFNIVSSRVIQVKDLPEYLLRSTQNQFGSPNDRYSINFDKTDFSLKNEVEAFEKEIIQRAIDQTGSYVLAAQKLKLTKQALNYKLNKYGIDR